MASLLDISLVQYFSNIFVALFIFVIMYIILLFKKPFNIDNKGISALMSALVALLFLFSDDAIAIIKNSIPWYVIMLIAFVFVVIIVEATGAKMPAFWETSIGSWVLIIAIFILILNISIQIGGKVGPYVGQANNTVDPYNVEQGGQGDVASGSFTQNLGATLFHPKVLALMVIILVAVFAIMWIGYAGG